MFSCISQVKKISKKNHIALVFSYTNKLSRPIREDQVFLSFPCSFFFCTLAIQSLILCNIQAKDLGKISETKHEVRNDKMIFEESVFSYFDGFVEQNITQPGINSNIYINQQTLLASLVYLTKAKQQLSSLIKDMYVC